MPDLNPPKVVGELSILNEYVVVENHLPGTQVNVWADAATVIGTISSAAGGRDQIPIDPVFLPLKAHWSITATQEWPGGPPSLHSPVPVLVQDPSASPPVAFEETVYDCVSFLRTFGPPPGARRPGTTSRTAR
jgi:hypothetical protein